MSTASDDRLWNEIEATRDPSGRTLEGEVPGHVFLRWHNGVLDRVLVLDRDCSESLVRVRRVHGRQVLSVRLEHIRTLEHILQVLGERYPALLPSPEARHEFSPTTLSRAVIEDIWGKSHK